MFNHLLAIFSNVWYSFCRFLHFVGKEILQKCDVLKKIQKVIKNVQSDAYTDTDQTNKAREVRIVITPDPTTADADDDFGFTTTISNFSDGFVVPIPT